jgi:hypothetical protein
MFQDLKGSTFESSFALPLNCDNISISKKIKLECRVAGPWILDSTNWLEQMMNARDSNKQMYFSRFSPSISSLSNYLARGPIENPNQILFSVVDQSRVLYGLVGLKLNPMGIVNVDNVLKISKVLPGIMKVALLKVMAWANHSIGIKEFELQVISTNTKAIALYSSVGFNVKERISLRVESLDGGITNLVPSEIKFSNTFEEMLIMKMIY